MNNPHIIVDQTTKRCLCGSYLVNGEPANVFCADILNTLELADHWAKSNLNPSLHQSKGVRVPYLPFEDLLTLVAVLKEHVEER